MKSQQTQSHFRFDKIGRPAFRYHWVVLALHYLSFIRYLGASHAGEAGVVLASSVRPTAVCAKNRKLLVTW